MPVTKRLTIENLSLDAAAELDAFDDQVITEGLKCVRGEGDELRRRGILDAKGNVISQELRADMKEGAGREFRGS